MKLFSLILLVIAGFVHAQNTVNNEYLRETERKGYDLYFQDFMAASATNVVSVERLQNSSASGWIVVMDGDNWKVRFVGECDEGVCSSFDVAFDVDEKATALTEFQIPEVIPGDQVGQWRARQLAISSNVQRCSETYNTVVLEGQDGSEPVWVVYLLAASRDPNTVVLGGHHRITVSADGSRIIKSEPLSQSCLQLAKSPDGTALTVTNSTGQAPLETHVFASLLYRIALHVDTGVGVFAVEGNEIRSLEGSAE